MNTNKSLQPSRCLAAAVSAVLSLAGASAAHGGPHNGVVTSGDAVISTPVLNLTQIDQSSHSASIDWQSFDIGAHERVIFNQPSASSVALNRILSQDPSQIHGGITANGRVFLLNPNGVIFGATSRVNVGSLVASSLDIADVDAATGRYTFNTAASQSGAISNSGQITAADGGSVTLLGGSVVNDGLIIADYGSVNLGAGRAATLHFDGDGMVRFQIDAGLLANTSGAGAAVDNTGDIRANGGQVLLTARAASDVIARAVNNDGVIRAARVENVGGRIRLVGPEGVVVNGGLLDATGAGSGGAGGQVQVLGERVELSGTALVDVSGGAGGGIALIGGGFRGADPSVLNAQQTHVHAGAVVRANSTARGNAGQVAVWADGTTTFGGDIFARAGGSDGDGGYAEISGREHLRIGGHAWLESAHGTAGALLLDPGSITITNGGNTAPGGDFDVINDQWINNQLAGSSLVIETSTSGNNEAEDLIVDGSANISWGSANSLTLSGDNSVSLAVGSGIASSGAGALVLQSAGGVSIGGTVTLAGNLTVAAGADITQSDALSVGGAASFTAGAGQSVLLDEVNTFSGPVNIAASGGGNLQDVTLRNSAALNLQALSISGNLDVAAGGSITQSGALVVAGASSFSAAGGRSVLLDDAGNTFTGAVSLASAGTLQNVTLRDSTPLDLQLLAIAGNLNVSADVITQSGALVVGDAANFSAGAGQSITLNNTGNAFSGSVGFAGRAGNLQNVALVNSTALQLGAFTIDGDLTLASGGSITQSGPLGIGGAAGFTAAGGQSVVLNDAGNVFTGAVSFASSGTLQNVIVRDSTALDLQGLSVAGNLGVTANGAITQSGALLVSGVATFAAAAGESVVLDDAGNLFGGAVNIAASSGNLQNVTLRDSTALDVQALAINGNLNISAGGAISQSGPLSVTGAASFRTLNDAGAGITLGGINTFGSVEAAVRNAADTANGGASIVINENDDTLLGDVQTGAGQSVSVVSAGAIAALANTDISTGALSLAASGDIGSAATPISLIAPGGSIDAVSSGGVYVAGASGPGAALALARVVAAGAIDLVNDGDLRVQDVRAGNAVSLTSTHGGILDDNLNGAGSQIVTGNLSLQAAGSIGEAPGVGNGTLDLQAASVGASAQGGGVYLDETDGDINIRQVSAAGPVWIQAGGGAIVDDPTDASAASITSTTGGVQLSALSNIGTVTDVPTRQGAPILIHTNGGALSAHVASATGQVNLDIVAGSHPTAGVAAISAGGAGRLLIQSAGDLSLSSFNSAISGFTEAGFSSNGTLQMSEQQSDLIAGPLTALLLHGANDIVQTDRVFDLGAAHLIFESGAQGGDVALNTNVGQLDAAIGSGANLTVVEGLGDITLGAISAGGDVSIRAADILDDGDLNGSTRVAAGATLSLVATAGIGRVDGVGGGRIDTASNALSVLADVGDVFISHLGNLQVSGEARSGLIDIAVPTGNITVSGVLRATGPVTLIAGADAVGAVPATAGDITLPGAAQTDDTITLSARGGGVIADAGDATTHLSARHANLDATLIGSESNRLDVDVESLNAGAPDGIYLNVANAVQLRTVAAQNVVINAAGAITDDGDAQTRITGGHVTLSGAAIGAAGAGGELDTSIDRLSATTVAGGVYIGELGDIQLAAVTASGAGNDVGIVASGAMSDDGDDATRVSGGNLTLAAASIGAADANGEIDTQAISLGATASSGGVFIGEADALQLHAITAAGGSNVVIAAGGALTDDGDDATRVSGENVALTGGSIGAADSRVDTAAAVLSATASDGGIHIGEQDDITLADVASAGDGANVDLRTSNNGSIIIQNLTTQGGAVNLMAGGTGSLNVTGAIASNNGVVNLTAGDALAAPSLSTGTGSVVLHTVNDLNVGAITAGSVSITSDTGDVVLGTVNAGAGPASITADNGTITDGTGTSLSAGQVTLSAQSIGGADNPLNVAADTLAATTSTGGLFVDEADGLSASGISSAGRVSLVTGGSLIQTGAITSAASAISVFADSIDMQAAATTISAGGDITYAATGGDITLAVLNAGGGRTLVTAADSVYSSLGSTSATNNIMASAVEVRAGGLAPGSGEIGTASSPLAISTPGALRSVYLIVPTLNGIQTSTPRINYSGPSSALLLKGYSGSSGALLFDLSSTFTPDAVLSNGESIVPLLNGRIAINSDSLSAATQALSSGVTTRVNIDWGAFDPNVSLFGTLDPALRLPPDQIDDPGAAASLLPQGTTLVVTRDGWRLAPAGNADVVRNIHRPAMGFSPERRDPSSQTRHHPRSL